MARKTAPGTTTKERIEAAALRLFVERGVTETTMRDIARAVGVVEGALYRHYTAKDELVGQLFRANYTNFADELERLQTGAETCRGKLAAMIGGFCRFFDTDPVLFRFLLFVQHGQLAKLGVDATTPVTVVERVLAAAMARNEIASRDPALATAWVFGIVLQTATAAVYGRIKTPLAPLTDDLVAAVWRALGGSGS